MVQQRVSKILGCCSLLDRKSMPTGFKNFFVFFSHFWISWNHIIIRNYSKIGNFIYRIEGSDVQATKAPTRIALLYTMIFSLLLYNYYSASIVSARLNEPLEKMNDSLNELAKSELKLGAEPILYFKFYLQVTQRNLLNYYFIL